MAKSNFKACLRYVLIDEGGNDDDPQDHGGRTSRGITQREYDSWSQLNDKKGGDVWEASSSDIENVYQSQYWNPYCDKLPGGVDYVFFDTSVNAGRSQAVKSFQKALDLNPDGMMGQITLNAIASADPVDLIHKVSEVRREFYRHLKQFPRYGRGWLSRVDHCERGALSLTSTNFSNGDTASPVDKSPKANSKDVATTTVSPETSTTTAASSGGLVAILNSFHDALQPYAMQIQYVTYTLLGVAAISFGYGMWGFIHRSKVQAAV